MTDTAPSREESPTCRVRHFSTDPTDPAQVVAGAKIKTISRVGLPGMQARGFAEVDADGNLIGSIPKADDDSIPKADDEPAEPAKGSAKTKTATTGGSD